jgi:phosphatidate cytidylyltransferase
MRIVTAGLGLPLLAWILLGPSWVLAVALAILCALAGLESVSLIERSTQLRLRLLSVLVPAATALLFGALYLELATPALALLWIALGALQAAVVLPRVRPLASAVASCAVALAAISYIALPLALVSRLQVELGPSWVALAIAVTWFGDAGSYAAGRLFGRHRVAPVISPGKTLEGCIGGIATAVVLALALRGVLLPELALVPCIAVAASANAIGQGGDLLESCLKRAAGVKDSGQLFPGYGGVLDKIDSLLLAGPWLYACSLVLRAAGGLE